jgi:uncharacterized DUF497 family protein
MKLEWDIQKNEVNIKKHRLDFADAHKVFENPLLVNLDDSQDYEEDRWIGIGLMDMRVVVIVFTEPDENIIRIISFRKATSNERKQYEKTYKNEFGTF